MPTDILQKGKRNIFKLQGLSTTRYNLGLERVTTASEVKVQCGGDKGGCLEVIWRGCLAAGKFDNRIGVEVKYQVVNNSISEIIGMT